MKIYTKIPFTYTWIIRHHLDSSKTVLDAGCGNGSFMKQVNYNKAFKIVGVELFDSYIQKAKKTGVYSSVLKKDVCAMKFKPNSFNATHASQVIEHLTKKKGIKFIQDMEKFSKNIVIIGTPSGHFHQEEYDGNKLQEHHSAWNKKDFEEFGFKVYGQGLKYIYGEHGMYEKTKFIPFIKYILFAISIFSSPFVYFNPQYAAHIIAVKKS